MVLRPAPGKPVMRENVCGMALRLAGAAPISSARSSASSGATPRTRADPRTGEDDVDEAVVHALKANQPFEDPRVCHESR
jgi:hypothetical protein